GLPFSASLQAGTANAVVRNVGARAPTVHLPTRPIGTSYVGRRTQSAARRSGRIGDLDQVVVRVAEIDGSQRPDGAGTSDGTVLDGDAEAVQPLDDGLERLIRDDAEVAGSRRRVASLRLELVPGFVQVDLLLADLERPSTAPERRCLDEEDVLVEPD